MANELAKAKLKVMAAVPYVQKQKAAGLKYSFAGEAAILEKLHPAMQEAGLTFAPTGCVIAFQEAYKTSSGTSMNRVIVQATFTMTHADSGQTETVQALGEGSDSGDKATSKAMTGALKYALRQAFLIETGDDPDSTPSEQQQRAATQPAKQAGPRWTDAAMDALIQEKNWTWQWVVGAINKNDGTSYPDANKIPDDVLFGFMDWLKTQQPYQPKAK